jgi:hypothetical protein
MENGELKALSNPAHHPFCIGRCPMNQEIYSLCFFASFAVLALKKDYTQRNRDEKRGKKSRKIEN